MLATFLGHRWIRTLSLVALSWTSAAVAAIDLSPEQIAQVRRWQVQDLTRCSSYRSAGEEAGAVDFSRRYPSCAHVYLANDVLGGFFTQPAGNLEPAQHCYYAGYKLGFMNAYEDLWGSCGDELSHALREADQEAMAQCRALAAAIKDYRSAVSSILLDSGESSNCLADQMERAQLMALIRTGDYEAAWRRIVRLQGVHERGLVPCYLLLGLGYKSEVEF